VSTPLPQCDAFYYIYNQQGDLAPGVLVTLKEVIDAGGSSILLSPLTTLTDPAGSFHFTLPEDAQVNIAARATGLWNCPEGRWFKVPPGPSGELIPDFTLPPSTIVEPPLIYLDGVLSIPKATATQDGYLSAADYVAFLAGATSDMGVVSFNTRTGEVMLLSNDVIFALGYVPINKDGDAMNGPLVLPGNPTAAAQAATKAYVDAHALGTIPGVAGTYPNPTSITVNAQGQVIAITRGTPDTLPPVISAVTVTSITATSATITWTTNEPADSQIEYGPTSSYGTSSTLDPSPVTTHSVTITGLTAITLYHYRVKSRDTASNLATSGDFTFTTTAAPDTTSPVISAVASSGLTATGATITWTTDEPGDSQVEYGPTTAYGASSTINPSLLTSHSVPITGLTASTLYHYRVKSRDAASNLATSGDFTFTTAAPPDITPPVISAVTAGALSATGATITWTTDEAADSQVDYSADPDTSYGTSTPVSDAVPPGTMSHNVVLTGLTGGTLYHYRVKSKDAAGNPAIPVIGTFTTTVDLLTGLISMWQLGEPGTANRIDSVGSNDLLVASAVTSVAGKSGLGNATHFPGIAGTSNLQIPSNPSLQTGDIDYTVAFWVKLDDKASDRDFLGKSGGFMLDEYIIGYESASDRFRFTICGGSPIVYTTLLSTSAGSPSTGTWYLIVCWHDMATGKIYLQVNNGAIDEALRTEPMFSGAAPFSVGMYNNAGADINLLIGTMDEIAFWKNRAVTAAVRNSMWNGGAGLPFSSWT
jgi:hypothetical protein